MANNYLRDLTGKTSDEVLAFIAEWRNDDEALVEAASDLLTSVEKWLVANPVFAFSDKLYQTLRDLQDGHIESSVNVCVGKLTPELTLVYDTIVQAFKDHAANHVPDVGKVITVETLIDEARSFCLRHDRGFANDPVIHRLMANFAAEVSR